VIGFILGAVIGGAAVWLYGEQMRTYLSYLDDKTRDVRSKAADTLQAAAEGLQTSKGSSEGGIGGRRAG
jgi:hypothetical protein